MKRLLLLCMMIGLGSAVMAQQIPYSFIDINNVRGCILGNGCLMDAHLNTNSLSWEVPKGTEMSPLFQHSLWIGGVASDTLHLAGNRFGQTGQEYWSGPLKLADGTTTDETVQKFTHVWNVTKAEIDDFIAHHGQSGYVIPEDILTWPAHGDAGYADNLAPFVDVNGNGRYEPEQGDYPDIKGDQCLFFIFNDTYRNHTEFRGEKLGVEVHAMVYAFNTPDDIAMNNTVFFDYKIYNRSNNTYYNTFIGLWNDWDIGYGWDDYVGCDVHRAACFAYNGNDFDDLYGQHHPAQVCKILAGPLMDPDDLDNPAYDGNCASLDNNMLAFNGMNFGNGIVDDERLGMSFFISMNNTSNDMGDATNAQQAYYLLNGLWRSGISMNYGGYGYVDAVGPICNYLFPGDSDPCNIGTGGVVPNGGYNEPDHYWTAVAEGVAPNDVRGLASMGPFTFEAGSMKELLFSEITVFPNPSRNSGYENITEYIDHVAKMAGYPTTSVQEYGENAGESLKLYPNPTHDQFTVEGTGQLVIMNVLGQQILSRFIDGTETITLPEGMYFLRLEQENGVKTGKIVVN